MKLSNTFIVYTEGWPSHKVKAAGFDINHGVICFYDDNPLGEHIYSAAFKMWDYVIEGETDKTVKACGLPGSF